MPGKISSTSFRGEIVPTGNIALMHQVMESLVRRAPGVPGIGAFYGQSGLGKSFAAAYASHPAGFNGIYVQCNVYDTMKSLTEKIGKSLGISLKGRIATMMEQVIEAVAISNRPLILDEADVLVDTSKLELIRNLHDASNAAVLVIGEQNLPAKLKRHERFHNRVLVWQPAVRCNLADLDLLARQYCPTVTIAPELKRRMIVETEGVTRRVVTNLVNVKRWCEARALKEAPADTELQFRPEAARSRAA